jgi:alpha-tubulin suppressor-like RCC1 family protein
MLGRRFEQSTLGNGLDILGGSEWTAHRVREENSSEFKVDGHVGSTLLTPKSTSSWAPPSESVYLYGAPSSDPVYSSFTATAALPVLFIGINATHFHVVNNSGITAFSPQYDSPMTHLSCAYTSNTCLVAQEGAMLQAFTSSGSAITVPFDDTGAIFDGIALGEDITAIAYHTATTSIGKLKISLSSVGNDLVDVTTRMVAAGVEHILHLSLDGVVSSAGRGTYHQLGRDASQWKLAAVQGLPSITFTSVACLEYTSFALSAQYELYAWGRNTEYGLLGRFDVGNTLIPMKVDIPSRDGSPSSSIQVHALCTSCKSNYMLFLAKQIDSDTPLPTKTSITTYGRASFGSNTRGQLGAGIISTSAELPIITPIGSNMPVRVPAPIHKMILSQPAVAFGNHTGAEFFSNSEILGFSYSDAVPLQQPTSGLWGVYSFNVTEYWLLEGRSVSATRKRMNSGLPDDIIAVDGDGEVLVMRGNLSETRVIQALSLKQDPNIPTWTTVLDSGLPATMDRLRTGPAADPSSGLSNLYTYLAWASSGDITQFIVQGLSSPSNPGQVVRGATFSSTTGSLLARLLCSVSDLSNCNLDTSDPVQATCGQYALPNGDTPKEFISGRSRILVLGSGSGSVYTCGTNNTYGELGYLNAPVTGWFTMNALGSYSIVRLAALDYTNYALNEVGSVFVWGLNGPDSLFGFPTLYQTHIPMTIPWTSTRMRVTEMFPVASANAVHFYGDVLVEIDIPGVAPQPTTCGSVPRPSTTFLCIGGVWTSNGTVIVDDSLTLTAPTVIVGDLQTTPGSTLTITLPLGDTNTPIIKVTGCVAINGSLVVLLTTEDLKSIEKSPGSSRSLQLISASCGDSDLNNLMISSPKDCRKVKVTRDQESSTTGISYTATFKVSRADCDRWWIILTSVLGGLIILIAIIAILFTVTPLKQVVRPYTKRSKEP